MVVVPPVSRLVPASSGADVDCRGPGAKTVDAKGSRTTTAVASADELALGRGNILDTLARQRRGRGMPGYVKALGGLSEALTELGDRPGAHWLDCGGVGNAVVGFMVYGANSFVRPEYRNGTLIEPEKLPPKEITATVLDLDCPMRPGPRIEVMTGRLIEQIPAEEMPPSDLITDVEGPFSYSTRPDLVLRRYVGALRPGGRILLGLGSTCNDTTPGFHNRVVGADGISRTYIEWLESIPGLEVKIHEMESPDPEEDWIQLSAEIQVIPGAEVDLPPLEAVVFREGGPPRMVLKEQAGGLYANPATCEAVEVHSKSALASVALQQDAAQFLDQFRSGSLGNPVASVLARQRGSWRHVGGVDPAVAEQLREGNVEDSERHPIGARLTALVTPPVGPIDFAAVGSPADLDGAEKQRLITDQGFFAAATRPDVVLRTYVDSIVDNGEIVLALGNERTGVADRSRVLTRKGENLSLAEWIGTIPGLDVDAGIDRGDTWAADEHVVRVRIADRAAVSVRSLQPLGATQNGDGPYRLLFREEPSEAKPDQTLGEPMDPVAVRILTGSWS